ncbi:YqcI/YcgG family protein [Bifidobacterium longum subsp. infantis]|uniref:YqcI/YcgG family protein n=1 Tax=Bifidobacterium longum subsp. infantis TaxID=1682 RepID=A0AAX1LMJ3_BIFLI|nr:YqcI/YcgG family protein [Bifidobacterium longum subsp. infantis]QSP98413.1 YqcI/YcgG family protein [Bifidobacterium longum subsp. infantis]QSZ18662.1 YqcI/YcgG family protein [Bifidobacterium longum subsp. infantis]QTB93814.1 YqcI/YcgG family protein [Bifidobacterium longum subsp. infantis]QUF86943.1 YqcI/YcgG family protein [Bifidobacterium longum subsp. infantis]
MNPGIRERIAQYDTIPMSPALGEHGNAPELPQFFLGDDNIEASMLLTEQDILRRIK